MVHPRPGQGETARRIGTERRLVERVVTYHHGRGSVSALRDPIGTSLMCSLRRALVDGKNKSKDFGNDHPKEVDERMTGNETSLVSSKTAGS